MSVFKDHTKHLIWAATLARRSQGIIAKQQNAVASPPQSPANAPLEPSSLFAATLDDVKSGSAAPPAASGPATDAAAAPPPAAAAAAPLSSGELPTHRDRGRSGWWWRSRYTRRMRYGRRSSLHVQSLQELHALHALHPSPALTQVGPLVAIPQEHPHDKPPLPTGDHDRAGSRALLSRSAAAHRAAATAGDPRPLRLLLARLASARTVRRSHGDYLRSPWRLLEIATDVA